MTRPVDPISDDDLQAYVDDEIDVARRIEVEAYLSAHPAEASRVMADLRIRDELRLSLADMPADPAQAGLRFATAEAARRLGGALSRDRWLRGLRRVAAVGLLVGAGWFAHAEFGPLAVSRVVASDLPPAYVEDALRAHRTAQVRAGMLSQTGASYDPAEIRAATAIVMPELPTGWSVEDVQVFPSAFGPSVEMSVKTRDFGPVSLFAVRPGSFDVVQARTVSSEDLNAAYWQIGEVAYALVAQAPPRELDRTAERLARSLY
ncbi:anti-sigma factor family protein [Ancylobacter mangrovi]|uniref:anti-sigma factor family protein n=1 Tax=Ancylobacter mangrovi TaxID=2972472 RepID=UPI0021639D4B|nr:anti-sigma factor [Ancylobacter mangrovi]MCS0502275.1 anti-sigma factor [Ancylobacter mangrovi]